MTLHEYGHALTARHYGIQTRSILLLPIGGVANLERMPEKPHQEMVIAIAGPLVNFAIAALLVPVVFLMGGVEAAGKPGPDQCTERQPARRPALTNLLLYLFLTNVLLALFNLLPAFPMDGGRLLRALLAMVIPYMQATRIAVLIGRLVAVGMAVYGIFTGGITLMLVAFFVYVGGSAELEAVSSRAVLRSVRAGAAIAPGAISLYTSERLERAHGPDLDDLSDRLSGARPGGPLCRRAHAPAAGVCLARAGAGHTHRRGDGAEQRGA